MRIRRPIVVPFLALWWLSAGHADAQRVSITMEAEPSIVRAGEPFVLRIHVEAEGAPIDDVDPPPLEGFRTLGRRVGGPMSFRFSFGGGGQSISATQDHAYTVVGDRAGTYDIPPATAVVGGRTYSSNRLRLEVTGQGQGGLYTLPPTGAVDPRPGATTGPSPTPSAPRDATAFLDTTVSNPTPFVGERTRVSVVLYTRAPLRTSPQITVEPTTQGLWVEDLLGGARSIEPKQVDVGGVPHYAYELKRLAAYPLTAGRLQVGSMTLVAHVGERSFFNLNLRSIERRSPEVPLEVRPLPAGAAGLPVLVGETTLALSVDPPALRTGEAATVTLRATGTGHLKGFRPTLEVPTGLRRFDPTITDGPMAPDGVGSTQRTLTWIVVPDVPGSHRIAPVKVAVVDPTTGSVDVRETPELILEARGTSQVTRTSVPTPLEGSAAEARPLAKPHPRSALLRRRPPWSASSWFAAGLVVPAMAWLALWVVTRMGRRPSLRIRGRRPRGPAWKNLETHVARGDSAAFYAGVAATLHDAVGQALGEPTGGYTHGALGARMRAAGIEPDLVERVTNELEGTDFARFSMAGATPEEMRACLGRTRALVERLGVTGGSGTGGHARGGAP